MDQHRNAKAFLASGSSGFPQHRNAKAFLASGSSGFPQHRNAKAFRAHRNALRHFLPREPVRFPRSGSNSFPQTTRQILAIMAIFLQLATICMALIILPLGIILNSGLFILFALFLITSSIMGIKIALQAWRNDVFGLKWPEKEGDQKQWTIK